jgi:hypothetical protein
VILTGDGVTVARCSIGLSHGRTLLAGLVLRVRCFRNLGWCRSRSCGPPLSLITAATRVIELTILHAVRATSTTRQAGSGPVAFDLPLAASLASFGSSNACRSTSRGCFGHPGVIMVGACALCKKRKEKRLDGREEFRGGTSFTLKTYVVGSRILGCYNTPRFGVKRRRGLRPGIWLYGVVCRGVIRRMSSCQ